jgi:hypothetical protein
MRDFEPERGTGESRCGHACCGHGDDATRNRKLTAPISSWSAGLVPDCSAGHDCHASIFTSPHYHGPGQHTFGYLLTVARSDIYDCTHNWIEVRHGTASAALRMSG